MKPEEKVSPETWIELEKIHPNEWNPNEQDEVTFNQLVKTISEEGFDQPIVVHQRGEDDYVIIKGEHRWRVARVLGYDKVPCKIRHDWDEAEQKLQTVRDNMLRGEVNRAKFTKLVNEIQKKYGLDHEAQAGLMGFKDMEEFYKNYLIEKERRSKELLDDLAAVKDELRTLDNLSTVIREIFTNHREEVELNFAYFMFGRKKVLMVEMDKDLKDQIERVVDFSKGRKVNINLVLSRVIADGMKGM